MTRVAGYFRVSQARDDMKAPELYKRDIEMFCTYRKLVLAEVFSDIDYSAFRGAPARPALEELKRRRREFSGVVVPKLSRFGRSVKDLIELFDVFERDGVALMFLDMGLDTSTSQGRLLRHIMSAFAEYESDVRADYFRAANDARLEKGLPPLGWVAYGYRRRPGTYEVLEREARVVRDVFDRYASGESMISIVRRLNNSSVLAPKGGVWAKATIRKFLDNHHYAGLLKREGELRRGVWEPVVGMDLWERVQTRRLSVSNRGACATRGLYLLSGLIECEVCGSTLHHRTKQDRVPGQYVCRGEGDRGYCLGGGIAEHRAESLVVEAYLERFGSSMVYDAGDCSRPESVVSYWGRAMLGVRRAILRSSLERVLLLARDPDNRRGIGLPRGRSLAISWAVRTAQEDSALVLGRPSLTDQKGAKVCTGCGRRRHLSNFRLDANQPDGRMDRCTRCRASRGLTAAPNEDTRPSQTISYQAEWRRFQEACRERAGA